MSVIEDTRKLLQDFLAPELRAIAERLDALEKSMGIQFGAQEKSLGVRFDAQEKSLGVRFDAQEKSLGIQFDAQEKQANERFKALEWRMSTAEQLASERHVQLVQAIARMSDVFELKERIARIEARERAS
jgi:hypothetical protein